MAQQEPKQTDYIKLNRSGVQIILRFLKSLKFSIVEEESKNDCLQITHALGNVQYFAEPEPQPVEALAEEPGKMVPPESCDVKEEPKKVDQSVKIKTNTKQVKSK